jgi:SprT-like family
MIHSLDQLREAFALHEYAILSKGRYTVQPDSSVKIDKSVKFKVPWVSVQLSNSATIAHKYLEERWHWANIELFGGEMKMPVLTMEDHKALGFWRSGDRKLNLQKKLFKLKTDEQILGTLFHEMAHQYEDEVAKTPWRERMQDAGHGPGWIDIMNKIGMPPDKNFTGDDVVLKTEKEKENLNLRNSAQNTEFDPKMLQPKDFEGKEYLYAYFINYMLKEEPIIVLNKPVQAGKYDSTSRIMYYYLDKRIITRGQFPSHVNIRACKKLSPRELASFPAFFKTVDAMKSIAFGLSMIRSSNF